MRSLRGTKIHIIELLTKSILSNIPTLLLTSNKLYLPLSLYLRTNLIHQITTITI